MENRDGLEVDVALTGGAVFDYVSGGLRRGPRVLTDNGFEWLAPLALRQPPSSCCGCLGSASSIRERMHEFS
jgi:hypothetical protein